MSAPADRACWVGIRERVIVVHLVDGRIVEQPVVRFPRLAAASTSQLEDCRLIGNGEGIHWPSVDEDLSVRAIVRGAAAGP